MVNRLLQKCPKGRQRKLRLRTYAVICLNEECGMLEWVPNTTGLRQVSSTQCLDFLTKKSSSALHQHPIQFVV